LGLKARDIARHEQRLALEARRAVEPAEGSLGFGDARARRLERGLDRAQVLLPRVERVGVAPLVADLLRARRGLGDERLERVQVRDPRRREHGRRLALPPLAQAARLVAR